MAQTQGDERLPAYTPQALSDILPIYHTTSGDDSLETYTLHQIGPTLQELRVKGQDEEQPALHIKIFATGGFMNKKPHIIITRQSPPDHDLNTSGRRKSIFSKPPSPSTTDTIIAEGRFDIHGTGTSIAYLPPQHSTSQAQQEGILPTTQRLELRNSSLQILRTSIDGQIYHWQPHPGNSSVLELVDECEDIVARFTYTTPTQRAASFSSPPASTIFPTSEGSLRQRKARGKEKEKVFRDFELGKLELVAAKIHTPEAREEIRCSAIVVVERAKRRKINLGLATGKGAKGWDGMAVIHGGVAMGTLM